MPRAACSGLTAPRRLLMILLVCMVSGLAAHALAREPVSAPLDTASFIEHACISYTATHVFPATPHLWNRVAANPYLMGKLWEYYGFEPGYVFHRIGDTIRLIDPTGIDARLTGIGTGESERAILADGRLRGWGLPIGIKGRVLFLLSWEHRPDSVSVKLRLFGEGTGSAADVIIKTFSPLLRYLIGRRFSANAADLTVILHDLQHTPEAVRARLPAVLHDEFDRFLSDLPAKSP